MKLKIHFLEESLSKSGSGLNEAALKENTALKVDRVTLQKDLSRAKATLSNAERELETYRRHLQTVQEEMKRKHADENLQEELESLRCEVAARNAEVLDLKKRLESGETKEKELDRLNEQLSETEEQLRTSQHDQMMSDERLEALEDELAVKDSEVLDLRRQLESAEVNDEEIDKLNRILSETEEQLNDRQKECSNYDERLRAVEGEVDSKTLEALELKRKLESDGSKEEEIDGLHAMLTEMKEQLRVSQHNHLISSEKMQALEIDLASKASDLLDLRNRLESEQGEAEELNRLQTELSETKEELRSFQRDRSVSQEKIQALEDEIEVLQATYEDEADASESRDRELVGAKQKIERLEAQIAKFESRFAAGEQDEEDLREQLKSLSSELDSRVSEARDLKQTLESVQDKEDVSRVHATETLHNLRREVSDTLEKLRAAQRQQSISDERYQSHDRELQHAKQRIRLLEQDDNTARQLSIFEQDLARARTKETEYLQREAIHKENIRDLRQQVARLERQLHELEISRLAVSSPQSSEGGSARKDEILEVRRQLAEAHLQIKDSRTKFKERERELQRQLVEVNTQAQSDKDQLERERDHLELELSSCRMQHDQQVAKNSSVESQVARLRNRLHDVEKDLRAQRDSATGDLTMAAERKELHEMLKDAKLTEESLQHEVSSRETLLAASSSREKELRTHMSRIREERNVQHQKSIALTTELEHLQSRYEKAVDNLSRQQKAWEEERRMIKSDLQSGDTAKQLSLRDREKRHERELRGLTAQVHWLRAQCKREEYFRASLSHGKHYLLKQIAQHDRYNKAELDVLESMGIKQNAYPPPPLHHNATMAEKCQFALDSIRDPTSLRPKLKSVALLIRGVVRMKILARSWAEQKKNTAEAVGRRRDGGGDRRRSELK